MDNGTEYLTPEEAAKYLKVAKGTIYYWIHAGKIPASKLGTLWRINKKDLDDLLQAKKRGRTMSNNELQESLKRTLEALNELDAETLADMIYKWGPPPAGWALDVYMRNGKVLFTDYYSAGTLLAYEPDEIVITTIDNTQRDWDPTEVYTVGDTWELSDELVDKYRGYLRRTFLTMSCNIGYGQNWQSLRNKTKNMPACWTGFGTVTMTLMPTFRKV